MLRFDSSLQCIRRTTYIRRALPGVVGNVWRHCRVALAWIAANRIWRKEKFHAFDHCGRRRRRVRCIRLAASDPLCAGRHPNLVAHTVIADHRTSGVAAVTMAIARLWRVVATWVAYTVMNGVMPIVI